jgi:formylglycine-generating enzyme required for sulfatase activity
MKLQSALPLLLATLLCAAAAPAGGQTRARPVPLEGAINEIAQHMLTAYSIKAPRNNLAVMQFVPLSGQPRRLGENLMQKVRIRMFDLDGDHRLNFVSQGKVTELIVNQGADSLREIYDGKRRVELGKLLTADHFVYGTYEAFSDGTAEIVAYLVEIESGLIRAQKVVTASGVPEYLMEPLQAGGAAGAAGAFAPRSYRLSSKSLSSDPEAAKKYRMADLFEQRGRTDRSEALRSEILAEYPDSLEAMHVQARRMTEDVTQLTALPRYDDALFAAIQAIPVSYAGAPEFRALHGKVILWMVALGNRELEQGREPEATAYFEKARNLGLPDSEYAAFKERVKAGRRAQRAQTIRAHMLRGERDQAELMLVEWEAEDPRNPAMRNLKKEFERMEGMVTIPAGSVNGRQIDPFNLDIYETTNKEFLEFVKANPDYQKRGKLSKLADKDYLYHWSDTLRYDDDLDNRPVVFISQPIADAYCKWRKKRLPTSDEWGLAAGEGRRKYPWGDKEPTDELANFNKGLFGKPEPGAAYPQGRTPEGVYNMGGNVWEITSTVEGNNMAISRGGCYYDTPEFLASSYRGTRSKDHVEYASRFMGVRCAQ